VARLLAKLPLGEPQPCDIDINPLAHHRGGRLSNLRLLSPIATAQGVSPAIGLSAREFIAWPPTVRKLAQVASQQILAWASHSHDGISGGEAG
jgi:hypothetical protein